MNKQKYEEVQRTLAKASAFAKPQS